MGASPNLDDALKYLLLNVIETYFRLSQEESERFRQLLSKKEERKMEEVELTYFDELELKGVSKESAIHCCGYW